MRQSCELPPRSKRTNSSPFGFRCATLAWESRDKISTGACSCGLSYMTPRYCNAVDA
jgi:hypothetical protein